MSRITALVPLPEWLLEIHLDNGSTVTLDLSRRLRTARFGRLTDEIFFRTAVTDGTFIRWGSSIEISLHEVFQMAED